MMQPFLKPMLCGTVDEVPEGPEWVLEGKLDGWRAVCNIDPAGKAFVYGGRNGNCYSGKVPYIEDEVRVLIGPDSAVDGELVGVGWGDVQGVMTRGDGPHVPSSHVPALRYVVFDVTRLEGVDMRSYSWLERRSALEECFVDRAFAHLVLSPIGESTQASHDAMLALGLEGSVCKRKDSRYVNSRSPNWVKCKPQSTAEAKIVGFKLGKVGGRWDGKVGAFIVDMLDEHDVPTGAQTTVKCGTDENHLSATAEREHYVGNGATLPDGWLGSVIEINHHGIGATGKPRHPMFVRRRTDRVAKPAPRVASKPRSVMAPVRMRNYGAMGDGKLVMCLAQLRNGGDARERVLTKGGNPEVDLGVVEGLARERGLI